MLENSPNCRKEVETKTQKGTILYERLSRDDGMDDVSDGIDTAKGEDDFTPFRAIFAEWYAKDASRKIRAVFKSRTEAGYHCTGSIPYGYIHDPNNRQNWLVDEEAAKVIRHIFSLVTEGTACIKSRKFLNKKRL